MSLTSTYQETFTITDAKKIASKVATDLKRMQRYYGSPTDQHIADLEEELAGLLKGGYLNSITYGYQRDGKWIVPTLKYTAHELSVSTENNDDPGRVPVGADINGASFYSYLISSTKWSSLTEFEKERFEKDIPIKRTGAAAPGVNGSFNNDKTYSSGGRSLDRSTLKSY
jgi:hypothetical protein